MARKTGTPVTSPAGGARAAATHLQQGDGSSLPPPSPIPQLRKAPKPPLTRASAEAPTRPLASRLPSREPQQTLFRFRVGWNVSRFSLRGFFVFFPFPFPFKPPWGHVDDGRVKKEPSARAWWLGANGGRSRTRPRTLAGDIQVRASLSRANLPGQFSPSSFAALVSVSSFSFLPRPPHLSPSLSLSFSFSVSPSLSCLSPPSGEWKQFLFFLSPQRKQNSSLSLPQPSLLHSLWDCNSHHPGLTGTVVKGWFGIVIQGDLGVKWLRHQAGTRETVNSSPALTWVTLSLSFSQL